jgi:hypothetical protein
MEIVHPWLVDKPDVALVADAVPGVVRLLLHATNKSKAI